MSRELDEVTHAFAALLGKIKLLNNPDLEAAVVKAVDCLIMALGGLEHRITQQKRSAATRMKIRRAS
jgi:hypothetical protein